MLFWVKNIRATVYSVNFALALMVYGVFASNIRAETEIYGVLAAFCLYLTLLSSPLKAVFPGFKFLIIYHKARKALGISSFFFALMHASLIYFGVIGGISGLLLQSRPVFFGMFFGFMSLSILTALAITSIQYFHKKLGANWKRLHRMVYVAAVFSVLYACLAYANLFKVQKLSAVIWLFLLLVLALLEALRFL